MINSEKNIQDSLGIRTIGDFGSVKKKHGGIDKSYDDWFESTEWALDNAVLKTDGRGSGSISVKHDNEAMDAMRGYVKDYKKYSDAELKKFKAEAAN